MSINYISEKTKALSSLKDLYMKCNDLQRDFELHFSSAECYRCKDELGTGYYPPYDMAWQAWKKAFLTYA